MSKQQLAITDNGEAEAMKTAEHFMAIYKHNKQIDLPIAKGKPLVGAAMDKWFQKKHDENTQGQVERGIGYLLKKKELGHGMFQAWIKQMALEPRTVQREMQVAEMLNGLSQTNATRVSHLPLGKQLAIAGAPAALIDDLFNNDELNDEMSREHMREVVRLETKVSTLSVKLDTAVQRERELKEQLKNKQHDSRFPEFVDNLRHESASLSYRMDLCTDDMQVMFNDLVERESLLKDSDTEGNRHMRVAYTSLYHNLNGAVARAYTLLSEMRDQLDDGITGPVVDNQILFDNDEALAAAQNRGLLLIEHEHDKLLRQKSRGGKNTRRGGKGKA